MPKRSLIDQLEQAVQAMLARPDGRLVGPREDLDPSVVALLGIARDLRDLPREDFKVRLRTNLERSSQMENAAKQAISRDASKQADTMQSGYHTIAPYIIVPRAGEFIEFLTTAFGGKERFRVPRGPGSQFIMHAEVAVGNSIIELADANEQFPAAPTAIHLYVDDADSVFARASRGPRLGRPAGSGTRSVRKFVVHRDDPRMDSGSGGSAKRTAVSASAQFGKDDPISGARVRRSGSRPCSAIAGRTRAARDGSDWRQHPRTR